MHKVAEAVKASVSIPLLHLADATAEVIKKKGLKKIALLGTRFTMEEDFYKGRLVDIFGLDVVVPNEPEREVVHRVIYAELCLGKIDTHSREKYISIINRLKGEGVEGVILGCTEIGLLVKQEDTDVPFSIQPKFMLRRRLILPSGNKKNIQYPIINVQVLVFSFMPCSQGLQPF
jgi:aspartate racemase